MSLSFPYTIAPSESVCRVRREHLSQLAPIMKVLGTLNDPFAAGNTIAEQVLESEILSLRLLRTVLRAHVNLELHSMDQTLNVLGNRALEAQLLQLLEDLTILKAELEDEEF